MNESELNILNQMKRDKRFVISKSFCGYSKERYCVFFCNKMISNHATLKEAEASMVRWNKKRIGV